MILAHYYALVGGAVLLTIAWLFRADARTGITTLGSFLAWGLAALLGGNTETYTDAGANITTVDNTTLAVSQGETLTTAPVPDEIRLFATLWALLSALALLLYVWGVYPPTETQAGDGEVTDS